MSTEECQKRCSPTSIACACHNQIVWHFDQATVIVCEECERTFHYTDKICPHCNGELTEYVRRDG